MSGRAPLRVVLVGSESTGKTELAEWLAAELRVPMSAEYAREYAALRGGSAALTPDDVAPIASGQLDGEEAAIAAAVGRDAPIVVHDTDLLSTLVYATEYYGVGAVPAWLPEAVVERVPDLYLLCDIDVPWHGDPVRDDTRERQVVQAAFAAALALVDAPVVPVRGSRAVRREIVRRAVEAEVARSTASP
jgi:nicotinamide riboside kinase